MRKKMWVVLAVVVAGVAAALAWLVVPGGWIKGTDRLRADGVMTVTQYSHDQGETVIMLTDQQVQQLQSLVEDSVFMRMISSEIRSTSPLTRYDVTLETAGGNELLVSCSIGQSCVVTVHDGSGEITLRPFSGTEWGEKFEGILGQ